MDIISQALVTEIPLPIAILSDLGKGSLRKALLDVSSSDDVHSILAFWPKLVLTASSPRVNDKHITSASNALSVYLAAGVGSTISEIQQLVLSRDAWFDAFKCAHKAFNDGKTKPAFQVLETLCDLIQKRAIAEIEDILGKAALPLVRIILLGSPRSDIKKASLMLSYFCRRTSLSQQLDKLVLICLDEHVYAWSQRLLEHNILLTDVTALGEGSIAHLFLALVLAMIDLDTRSAALKLFSSLRSASSEQVRATRPQSIAERAIQLYLDRNHAAAGNFAENVLPVILDNKEKLISFVQPYAASSRQNLTRMSLFVAILRVARAKAILSEPETLDILNSAFPPPDVTDHRHDKLYWCKNLLMTSDTEVQILTYGLLVSSPAGNAVVSPEVLDSIALSMTYLHDHAEAHERGEILSITKRLLRRLQNSAMALRRSIKNEEFKQEIHPTLASYKSFTMKVYIFLKDELNTGVSYPRHILSLLSLQLFFDHEVELDALSTDAALVAALMSLVLDPFEDVRSTAATLLQRLAHNNNGLFFNALSPHFLQRVMAMTIRTGRADHADAFGRLSALQSLCISSLQRTAKSPGDSLVEDIRHLEQLTSEHTGTKLRPGCSVAIHGELLSVSYRLQYLPLPSEQIPRVATLLLQTCMNVWHQVRLQLCVDSPETATEVEDNVGDQGPKDLLAYSWRALRDSSVALQSLIAVAEPSYELFLALGDLCMDQLIFLRHRGAFSTVAQTFTQCCDKIRLSVDVPVRDLVRVRWYQAALSQIDEQADRLTRRSAGLPATITALLNPADISLFSSAITDFMAIAQRPIKRSTVDQLEETKLPQVHGLNCLKDIMTNSKFSVIVGQYLESMLELASDCLSSKTWAIRNCGLMLLRACISRLDTSTTLGSTKPANESMPKPIGNASTAIALRLLSQSAPLGRSLSDDINSQTEHTFAGLDLLAHVTLDDSTTAEALLLVTRHLSHPVWAVRESAARLLATGMLTPSQSPTEIILEMLESSDLLSSENAIHGRLLCCRYLLEIAAEIATENDLRLIIQALDVQMTPPNGGVMPHSAYVYAAWLDVLNDAASTLFDRDLDGRLLDLHTVKCLMSVLDSSNTVAALHHSYVLQRLTLLKTLSILMRYEDPRPDSEEVKALIARLVDNPDTMSFTLEVLGRKHCHKPFRASPIFLVSIIRDASERSIVPPYLLQQLFTCLAKTLDHAQHIPLDILQTLLRCSESSQLHTLRELRVAGMELRAMLLACAEAGSHYSDAYLGPFEDWFRVVQHSAGDEVDFPTRLGAVKALSKYIGCLQHQRLAGGRPQSEQNLLLLLYNLLNDDDEEIRLEAVDAARKLGLHTAKAMDNLGYCALAARNGVLSELQSQFNGTPELAEAALLNLVRLWNSGGVTGCHYRLTALLRKSVASRLLEIAGTKNDLFAEERQNLYIDDLREIKAWTEVLHCASHNVQGLGNADMISDWILEGQKQVIELLEIDHKRQLSREESTNDILEETSTPKVTDDNPFPESLFGHPLGITYDHEILVILVQVVSLAGVLYQHDKTVSGGQCHERLERIRTTCLSSAVNPVFLGAIDRALNSG